MVHSGSLGTLISTSVTDSTEIIFQFEVSKHLVEEGALRIFVGSDHSAAALPLLIVVRYTQGVLSWQLPLVVRTDLGNEEFRMTSYHSVNRTLCPADNYPLRDNNNNLVIEENRTVLVSFSTASPQEVMFQLRLIGYNEIVYTLEAFSYRFFFAF